MKWLYLWKWNLQFVFVQIGTDIVQLKNEGDLSSNSEKHNHEDPLKKLTLIHVTLYANMDKRREKRIKGQKHLYFMQMMATGYLYISK